MLEGFILGIVFTIALLYTFVAYGFLATHAIKALWATRRANLFVWSLFMTYFRHKGWKTGPVYRGRLTRQQRRFIERERVRLGLL